MNVVEACNGKLETIRPFENVEEPDPVNSPLNVALPSPVKVLLNDDDAVEINPPANVESPCTKRVDDACSGAPEMRSPFEKVLDAVPVSAPLKVAVSSAVKVLFTDEEAVATKPPVRVESPVITAVDDASNDPSDTLKLPAMDEEAATKPPLKFERLVFVNGTEA